MQRNHFLMITTVVYALFGLGLLFAPHLVASLYGTSFNVGGETAARLFGALLLGTAGVHFWACESEDSVALTAILRGGLIYSLIALVLSLWFTWSAMWGAFGWSAVILFVLFSAGYAYYASR
jgi:hypothetical protein